MRKSPFRAAAVWRDRLVAETHKLVARSSKLNAEDAFVAPRQITVAAVGGIAGLIAVALTPTKALGVM